MVTPAGKIVDHGTEFGVDVDADGSAEVQVYLGAVVITPSVRAVIAASPRARP
ncbi:hypothetical protein [Verrucomicrobium spinosum]|uniref:hypothetical protein n=1 Tax=Verrucomicrobium spinosum TaxID=2736 RepID=UPI000AA33C4E|nr:hypothetical protein [Verrucomicrobium spinosum]